MLSLMGPVSRTPLSHARKVRVDGDTDYGARFLDAVNVI